MFLLLLFTLISMSLNCKLDPNNDAICELKTDSTTFGCLDNQCLKLCNLGQFDCTDLTKIICEYGYFNYLNTCVRCPKQNYIDLYTIYCGDCIDNSQTWKDNRQCTYDYVIEDIDYLEGTYIKKINSFNEFYFIIDSQSNSVLPNRYNQILYETLLCNGCSNLCLISNTNCNQLSSKIDKEIYLIQCLEGYYFFNDACVACSLNCINCDQNQCYECLSGYYLSSGSCTTCQTNCLDCGFDNNELQCYQCQRPYIISLDRKLCESCGDSCLRCEYVSYFENTKYQYYTRDNIDPDPQDVIKYVKRCRQCESDYTLHYNGEKCVQCYIPNCIQCYYKIGTRSTMDLDFKPLQANEQATTMLCYTCQLGYYLKNDLMNCEPIPSPIPTPSPITFINNCLIYGLKEIPASNPTQYNAICLRCTNLLDFSHNTCSADQCTQYIKNCQRCFKYNDDSPPKIMKYNTVTNQIEEVTSNAELLYQCTSCDTGYFANFFTGQCEECPNHCTMCWQYSPTYNFTLFNQLPNIIDNRYSLFNETISIFCSKCETNYQLYNNQCLGCTNNCVAYDAGSSQQSQACLYKSSYALCSKCFEPYYQRSLKSDLTECWECPYYCLACENRDISKSPNKYFNNQILQKYSRSCYKIQENPLSPNYVFFNSYLNLPIICNTNFPCRHSMEIDTILYCDSTEYQNIYSTSNKKYYYDVNAFYTEVSQSVAIIKLSNLEDLELYDLLNKMPLEILKLNIYFKGDSNDKCSLEKSTQIITAFHQNVFALTDFTIKIASYNDKQLEINIDGNFTMTNYPKLILKYLTFKTNGNSFIFNISDCDTVQLQDVQFIKQKQESYSIYLENIISLQFTNVYIGGQQQSDIISFSPVVQINFQSIILQNLFLKEQVLIKLQSESNVQINDLQILNCTLYYFKLIGAQQNIASGTTKLQNILLNNSTLNNTFLFSSSSCDYFSITHIQIRNNILISTDLFVSNIFVISQTIAHNNIFTSSSCIFKSSDEIDDSKLLTLALSNFTQVNLTNNTCDDSLIDLKTPFNQVGNLMNVLIESLYIDFLTTFIDNHAIISINQVGSVQIFQFVSHNLLYVTALEVISSYYVIVEQFECVSPNMNTQLPVLDSCVNDYNWYCLHIEDFDRGVMLEGGVIKKQLGIDCSMIYIKSYDFLTKNTEALQPGDNSIFFAGQINEYIKINNLKFYNVTLAIKDPQISLALIFIESSQQQTIQISDIEYIGNHLHQWPPSINVYVATCIFIESPLGNVSISNFDLSDNRATKTKQGILNFIVNKISIKNIQITDTNLIQQNYADILDLHPLFSNNATQEQYNIQSYFEVTTIGTNFYIYSDSIQIDTVSITNSYGLDGTGFYILGSQDLQINITNLIMKNIYCSLDYDTEGCGIHIDSQLSSLNLKIQYLQINKIIGFQGSGIFIESQQKQVVVQIEDSIFSDCEGLDAQAFYFKQQTPTTIIPAIIFSNCTFQNLAFDNFLLNILMDRPQIQLSNKLSISSLIYVYFAQVTLSQCQFSSFNLISLIKLEDILLLNILDTIIKDSIIGANNLFDISLYSQKGGIFISGLKFSNIIPYPQYTELELQNQVDTSSDSTQVQIQSQFNVDTCIIREDEQFSMFPYQEQYFNGQVNVSTINREPPLHSIHNSIYSYYTVFSQNALQLIKKQFSLIMILQTQYPSFFKLPEMQSQSIIMNKLTIENNYCNNCDNGLIYMYEIDGNVILKEINCLNNYISSNGCINIKGAILPQNKFYINLTNSLFKNNTAAYGAGISISNASLSISNCQFYDNNATLIGGGLYFTQNNNNYIILSNIVIDGNIADTASALYLSGQSLPSTGIISKGNLGRSINEEIPQHLSIQMIENVTLPTEYSDGSDTIVAQLSLPSGQSINSHKYYYSLTQEQIPFDWIFRIVNLDRNYNRILTGQKSDYCTIAGRMLDQNINNKSFTTNYTSPTSVSFNNESYNLDNLIITFDPYLPSQYYLQLKFECSSIKLPIEPYPYSNYNYNYSLFLNLRTKTCQLGEAYQQQQCIVCNNNQYSLTNDATMCTNMNVESMEQVTPVMIKLYPGYWRYDNDVVDSCYNLQENCNGGWIPGDASCFTGHIGALCESCDIYGKRGDQYSISTKYKCGQCSQTERTNQITIVVICLFTLFQMILSVRGNYQMIENFIREQVLQSMGVRINNTQANLSILIKILINYIQIISALGTFRISIPTNLVSSIEVVANPTQSMAYSLDCFLIEFTITEILYFRMLWALVMPLLYLLIFFIGYFLGAIVTILPAKIEIIYTTFIYMFIYLQPTFIGGFVALLSSRTLGGEEFVQSDVQYLYSTDNHYFWMLVFAGPNLIGWGALFPYLFMHFVRKNYDTLTTIQTRRKFGYFYNEYTQHAYLWEFVKIFEKQFVLMALTYYEDTIIVKGLFVFLIVLIYGILSFEFNPYQSKRLNYIDQVSSAVCVVSLCLGVLIKASQNEDMAYLQIIMFLIIGSLNILFILILIYELLRGYIDKFETHIDKLRDKLSQTFPNLNNRPICRKFLINRGQLKLKVKQLWSQLRYQTHLGIKKRRTNKTLPLFEQKSIMQELERNDSHSRIESKANSRLSVMDINQEEILHLANNSSVNIKTPELQKIYPAELLKADSLKVLKKKRI